MKLKVKRLSLDAKLPSKANPGDAGWDLTAVSERYDIEGKYFEYDLGLSFEIEPGYVGLIFPRSSVTNKDLTLGNAVGVLDSSYRGKVTARFKPLEKIGLRKYKAGDKVAQLVIIPLPEVELEEVSELSNTERGSGGYGSSGN